MVHKERIVMAAVHTLVVHGVDMGGTLTPLVLSMMTELEDITNEINRTAIDSEIVRREYSATVTLAEVKLGQLAVILNLPVNNIVSSSSTLVLDSDDRDMFDWLAVGKKGSMPEDASGTRTFNFPRARSSGTPTYNLAKIEVTNVPAEFRFYADRNTAEVGTITDTFGHFVLFDTARSSIIALDGQNVTQTIYTAVNKLRILMIRVIYEEATSSNTGVLISVGKTGSPSFFALLTSEPSKSLGSVTEMTLINNILDAGQTLTVACAGGKVGLGAIRIQVELQGVV